MAASLRNYSGLRILKQCKDISLRRQTKKTLPKQYNTSFISWPRIKDVASTVDGPEDLKTFSVKLEGETSTRF